MAPFTVHNYIKYFFMAKSFWSFKKNVNWYLIGIFPIFFGILCYISDVVRRVNFWDYLWICPVIAIASGLILLSRNRFLISATIAWLALGPLLAFLFYPIENSRLWQFYHPASVIVLFAILLNIKKIFEPKGFVFGLTSFYTYILITSYLSGGKINMLGEWRELNGFTLYFGIFFAAMSAVVLLWQCFGKPNKKDN